MNFLRQIHPPECNSHFLELQLANSALDFLIFPLLLTTLDLTFFPLSHYMCIVIFFSSCKTLLNKQQRRDGRNNKILIIFLTDIFFPTIIKNLAIGNSVVDNVQNKSQI